MKNCSGLHCPGCQNGRTGGVAVLVAMIVVLALADHYAKTIGNVVSGLVAVVAITAASLTGAVLVAVVTAAVVMARRRALRRAQRAPIPRMKVQVIPGERDIRALPPAAPRLVNPANGHLFPCLCKPCSAYWASVPRR
jgi:hypothetical protein